jgi:hypothetical protein
MGKISQDAITHGFRGKFGEDLVFRKIGNQTFFARKGEVTVPATARQQATRTRFMEATFYASRAMQDAQLSQAYTWMATAAGMRSGYVAAIKDFMTMPEIDSVITRQYSGKVGSAILISTKIPVKITAMEITIIQANGEELERGAAQLGQSRWRYVTNATNPQIVGTRLIIKSSDRLGRTVVVERIL